MRPAAVAFVVCLALPWAAGAWAESISLPDAGVVSGWSQRVATREYDPKTLYEHIDGAADLFLAYGFARLAVAEYALGSGEHLITVDVYDMGEPINAFGIFTSERPPGVKPVALGSHGHSGDGVIAFWQGRYYVKVLQVAGDHPAEAMAFAQAATAHLPASAGLPAALKLLPTRARIADSERYVRRSALGHRSLENVVSAQYRLGKGTAELHLASLASPQAAKAAWKKLWDFEAKAGKHLAPLSGLGDAAFVVRDPSLGLMIAARKGPYLLVATTQTAPRPALTDLARNALAGL